MRTSKDATTASTLSIFKEQTRSQVFKSYYYYVKNDHASKMLFSHHIKISFGTEGLTTFFDCGHFWVILNVHAHSDYPSSKFIHCWASRDLHVISVQFGIRFWFNFETTCCEWWKTCRELREIYLPLQTEAWRFFTLSLIDHKNTFDGLAKRCESPHAASTSHYLLSRRLRRTNGVLHLRRGSSSL